MKTVRFYLPPMKELSIHCDAAGCVRGIVHDRVTFKHHACGLCGGRGSLSLETLCRAISENPSTVRRVMKLRRPMRAKVAARICAKLVAICERAPIVHDEPHLQQAGEVGFAGMIVQGCPTGKHGPVLWCSCMRTPEQVKRDEVEEKLKTIIESA